MISIQKIYLFVAISLNCCIAATSKESSILNEQLRSNAASVDIAFFTAFLEDFNDNFDKYTSIMNQNKVTLPQEVANYYYHLAPLPSTVDLQSDIAVNFPFTEFKSFITKFPWYSSLLTEGHITDFYLPSDFISHTESSEENKNSQHNNIATSLKTSDSKSITSSASKEPSSRSIKTTQPTASSSLSITTSQSTSTSQNNAIDSKSTLSLILLPLVLFWGFL